MLFAFASRASLPARAARMRVLFSSASRMASSTVSRCCARTGVGAARSTARANPSAAHDESLPVGLLEKNPVNDERSESLPLPLAGEATPSSARVRVVSVLGVPSLTRRASRVDLSRKRERGWFASLTGDGSVCPSSERTGTDVSVPLGLLEKNPVNDERSESLPLPLAGEATPSSARVRVVSVLGVPSLTRRAPRVDLSRKRERGWFASLTEEGSICSSSKRRRTDGRSVRMGYLRCTVTSAL